MPTSDSIVASSSFAVRTTDVMLVVSNMRLKNLQDIRTSCQIKEIESSRLNTDLLFPSWMFGGAGGSRGRQNSSATIRWPPMQPYEA